MKSRAAPKPDDGGLSLDAWKSGKGFSRAEAQGRGGRLPTRLTRGPAQRGLVVRGGVAAAVAFLAAKWERKTHLESFTEHSRYSISAVTMTAVKML